MPSGNPFSLTHLQSVIDAIKSSDVRTGETKYTLVDGRVSTELTQLGGGRFYVSNRIDC